MTIFYSCYVTVNCSDTNRGTIKNVVKHIDHIRSIAGVKHIGVGGDYNGVDKVVDGLEDVSKFPALFEALLQESKFTWTDEELAGVASKNVLRVMRKVEDVRDRLKAEGKMSDNTVYKFGEGGSECRTPDPM